MHLLMPVAAAHGGGKHALAAACGAAATDSSATCWQAACCDHDEDVAPPTPTSAWQQQRPAPAQRAACRALSLPGAAGAPASSARRLLDSSGDYRAVCSWLDEQVSMRKAPRPRVLDIGALGQLDLAAAQGPPATPALQEEPRSCARGLPPPAFQLLGLL